MSTYNQTYSLPSQPVPFYPLSIVDIFFPGLTNISAALQQLQAGNSNSYVGILCICGTLAFLARYAYKYLRAFVTTYFTSTVHVSNSDEAYDMLITWVSSQPFANKASSSLASVGTRRRGFADGHSDWSQKKPLQYSPWNGSFSFWYRKNLITFRSVQTENQFFPKEEISVSCIGRSPTVLKVLFRECRTEYLKAVENKTSIFRHHNSEWKKKRTMDIRGLDTVILNEEKKMALLDDIKSFVNPQSKSWYSVHGIPYRRGYLLYGPPGTGKSSLSLSIAGACDLDIYILNLSCVDDDSLGELFTELPARCVILLEDIDAVDATHSRQHGTMGTEEDVTSSSAQRESGRKVSLSALLNVIDGVGSHEGRLLIMTTNHVERLDDALIRPGRVDMKLELGLTNEDINAQLFFAIFRTHASDRKEAAEKTEVVKLKKLEAEEETKMKELAAEFASKVPEHEFSPADVQLYLLGYRKSPAMAVQNVQEWVRKARQERGHIKRADLWVSEEEGSCKGNGITPSDNSTASATPQDGAQAKEMDSAIASMESPIPATDPHYCSSQVLADIKGICAGEEMPSVEQSLLLNYHSILEAYRSTHDDLNHSTLGLLNLLIDFVKETCTPTTVGKAHDAGGDATVSGLRRIWAQERESHEANLARSKGGGPFIHSVMWHLAKHLLMMS